MTKSGLILCLCIIGALLMIAISAYLAYKTVLSSETVCIKDKKVKVESEVPFDNSCSEHLKMTNVD